MKKVWITALDRDFESVEKLMSVVKSYGLSAEGHFWVDDVKKMSWTAPLDQLQAKETVLWIIMGPPEKFSTPTIRFGLAMVAVSVQFRKGRGFPIMILSGKDLSSTLLPTTLKEAEIVPFGLSTLGAKIAARSGMPVKDNPAPYHLTVHGLPGIGLWFEVGPSESVDWNGALFGVHNAEIDFHGVGPAGSIPERAVLEYPVKGLQMTMGEKEMTAWAIRNRLDSSSSYYVRVQGEPDTIVFGPYPEGDAFDAHVISF